MKTFLMLAAAIPMLPALAFSQNSANHVSPFACDRSALNAEERKRHFDVLGPKLRSLTKSARELTDGYEFEFAGDPASFQLVAEWASAEHRCCPFFDIDLRLEREAGSLWLRLTGREGVKPFIRSDFSRWFKP
jgi:hypothetical protein